MGLVKATAEREGARRRGRACPVSLVDETSLPPRPQVCDGGSGRGGQPDVGYAPRLARFFRDQGPAWRRGVEVVATEGAAPYKAAIDQYLPRAQHVPDRFHVIRWFGTSLIQLRRAPRAVPRPGNPTCTAPAKTVSPPPNGNGSGNRLASPTATTPNLPGPQLGNLLPGPWTGSPTSAKRA